MKNTRSVLIGLLVFISITVNAMPQTNTRIELEKHRTDVPHKGQRSLDIIEVSAFFNVINESVLISNEDDAIDIDVSIIDILGGECIYSSKCTASTKDIELNLSGLLNEGHSYHLKIVIGGVEYHGNFDL